MDALKTVAPADGGAAAFTVTGEANKAFTLYGAPSINMITAGGGSADKEIVVVETLSLQTFQLLLMLTDRSLLKLGRLALLSVLHRLLVLMWELSQ